jgi:hypothetical protein
MSFDNPALGMYDAGHVNANPNFGSYNGGYRQRSGSMRSQGSASPPQYQVPKGFEQKLPAGYEPGWGGLSMNVNLGMGMNGMGMPMHGGF